jgi:hypothetical protein
MEGIEEVWSVALIDMQHYADDNDSYRYFLAFVYVFSKFGWMRVLKQKTSSEVLMHSRILLSAVTGSLRWCGVTSGQKSTTSMSSN